MTNAIVMTNAWEIARDGKNKFGGKVKEYFAESLRIAWSIIKGEEKEMSKADKVNGIIEDINFPELEGSPKQIEWANKIRAASIATLKYEVTHEEWKKGQPKRSVEGLMQALHSKEGIEELLEDKAEFLVEGTIESMNDILDRYARLKEIVTNPSAEFWIDNRDNQEKNFKFVLFAEYVQTGVKKF